MIERIKQETDAANLNNAVMSTADKKLSSSVYYVLGLTMTDESKSLKIVRNAAVGEGAIAVHKLLAEYQPDIVNRHLGLLMSTMNCSPDGSSHCNQRVGSENQRLRIAER